VPSLFRRKATDAVDEADTSVTIEGAEPIYRSKAYTPSKKDLGRTTPKRKIAGRRQIEAPPTNRREAARRMRLKQREARAEARAGMMAGKEDYLFARDKGPVKRLVRDIVDARRNVATYFLAGALVVLLGSSQAMPAAVRFGANVFWVLLAISVIVDTVLLCRRVKKLVSERFDENVPRPGGLYWYAIMRSLSFRRMRMPPPQVKIGESV
jgi:hypothetical protein